MVALVRRFGLVRKVEVFEFALVERGFDARAKFGGQFALLFDRAQDGLAAVFEFAEIGQLFFDGADLDFVEIAGRLLAIARDERDRAAFVEQFDGGDKSLQRDVQVFGDVQQNFRG